MQIKKVVTLLNNKSGYRRLSPSRRKGSHLRAFVKDVLEHLYDSSICFTPNYLCPSDHPSLFHSFFPDQMSAHQLRSDGWKQLMGWVCVARARAQTRIRARATSGGTGCSGDPGLLSQNLKMSFFLAVFNWSIWTRCPNLTCDWRQTWTVVRKGQESRCFFFFCCNWINVSFFFFFVQATNRKVNRWQFLANRYWSMFLVEGLWD